MGTQWGSILGPNLISSGLLRGPQFRFWTVLGPHFISSDFFGTPNSGAPESLPPGFPFPRLLPVSILIPQVMSYGETRGEGFWGPGIGDPNRNDAEAPPLWNGVASIISPRASFCASSISSSCTSTNSCCCRWLLLSMLYRNAYITVPFSFNAQSCLR